MERETPAWWSTDSLLGPVTSISRTPSRTYCVPTEALWTQTWHTWAGGLPGATDAYSSGQNLHVALPREGGELPAGRGQGRRQCQQRTRPASWGCCSQGGEPMRPVRVPHTDMDSAVRFRETSGGGCVVKSEQTWNTQEHAGSREVCLAGQISTCQQPCLPSGPRGCVPKAVGPGTPPPAHPHRPHAVLQSH